MTVPVCKMTKETVENLHWAAVKTIKELCCPFISEVLLFLKSSLKDIKSVSGYLLRILHNSP